MRKRVPAKAKGKLYWLVGGPWHGKQAFFTSDGGSLVFRVWTFHGRYKNSGFRSADWEDFG